MTGNPAILYLVCGKIAAGKSTLTADLGAFPGTVVISEDEWLPALYPGNRTVEDYIRSAGQLRQAIGPHIVTLLKAGVSVVLDFPANTVANREWMRSLFEAAGTPHQLHYLDLPDEVCLARLCARNQSGEHPYWVTDAQFEEITRHFVPPQPSEGFTIVIHQM